MKGVLPAFFLGLSCIAGAATPPSGPRPAPGVVTNSAAIATATLEYVIAAMKAKPPGEAVRERYRLAGIVKSVAPEGILLERAAAVEWKVEEVIVDRQVTRQYGPGKPLNLDGRLAYVDGVTAKPGNAFSADVNVVGTREVSTNGVTRIRIRVFKTSDAPPTAPPGATNR